MGTIGEFMGSASKPTEVSEGVRWGTLRHVRSSAKSWLQVRAWRFGWKYPWAYALLLEFYRIVPRIRFALGGLWAARDRELYMGPGCHPDLGGCHAGCKGTHARIQGIQEQQKVIPWMGRFEAYLFLRGWNAAERFLSCTHSSCSENGQGNIPSQPSVIVGTEEVSAQSKCDLLTPPPSLV
jgi:hypothetical protein